VSRRWVRPASPIDFHGDPGYHEWVILGHRRY
jgi:hypothetical protein